MVMSTLAALLLGLVPFQPPCGVSSVGVWVPSAGESFLGVLERGRAPGREVDYARLRLAFRRGPNGWQALSQMPRNQDELEGTLEGQPATLHWTLVRAGQGLGDVVDHRAERVSTYSQVGVRTMAPDAHLPDQGGLDDEFSGWSGDLSYHPLVAIAGRWGPDADGWIREAKPRVNERVAHVFRSMARPTGSVNQRPEGGPTVDRKTGVYVQQAYSSRTGDRLWCLGTQPSVKAGRCELDSRWFIETKENVTELGTGLRWLEAGDFDGDGKSEVLLWLSGYNRGGYVLLFDGLTRRAEFSWGYH